MCGTLKNVPSMLNGHKCRAYVKICSLSPVMVTSPYERKFLEWDDNHNEANKHYPFTKNSLLKVGFLFDWSLWMINFRVVGRKPLNKQTNKRTNRQTNITILLVIKQFSCHIGQSYYGFFHQNGNYFETTDEFNALLKSVQGKIGKLWYTLRDRMSRI